MNDSSNNAIFANDRMQPAALGVGAVAAVLCGVGAALDPAQFFRSYLIAFLYWWILTAGCLGLALVHQMTGGRWGEAARPFWSAGIALLPLVTVAFLPLALGVKYVYPWAAADFFAGEPYTENRKLYLSLPFFFGRAVVYFAIPLSLGFLVERRSNDGAENSGVPKVGAVGAVLMVLVASFAATDWGMSLDPEWYSTLYGGVYIAGGLLAAMGIVTAGVALTAEATGRRDEGTQTILHDLGKLLLAFLMIWAYLEFSQFMIIYAGNLPVEAVWYKRRLDPGWQALAMALVVLHFAVPFALLLSRNVKRHPRTLAAIAMGLVAVHFLEVYWTVAPSLASSGFAGYGLDVTAFVALGGFWVSEYVRKLKHRLAPALDTWPIADEGNE